MLVHSTTSVYLTVSKLIDVRKGLGLKTKSACITYLKGDNLFNQCKGKNKALHHKNFILRRLTLRQKGCRVKRGGTWMKWGVSCTGNRPSTTHQGKGV